MDNLNLLAHILHIQHLHVFAIKKRKLKIKCTKNILALLLVFRQLLNFFFLDLYPHIVLIDSDDLRQKSVELLQPIYAIRSSLSTKVTTALIDCMGILTKVLHIKKILLLFRDY